MLHARLFAEDEKYRAEHFTTCSTDRYCLQRSVCWLVTAHLSRLPLYAAVLQPFPHAFTAGLKLPPGQSKSHVRAVASPSSAAYAHSCRFQLALGVATTSFQTIESPMSSLWFSRPAMEYCFVCTGPCLCNFAPMSQPHCWQQPIWWRAAVMQLTLTWAALSALRAGATMVPSSWRIGLLSASLSALWPTV